MWVLHCPLESNLYFYWTTVSRPCSIANNTLKIEWQQLPQQRWTQKVKPHLCNTHLPGIGTGLLLVCLYLFQHHHKVTPSLSMPEGPMLSIIPLPVFSDTRTQHYSQGWFSHHRAANRWEIILASKHISTPLVFGNHLSVNWRKCLYFGECQPWEEL